MSSAYAQYSPAIDINSSNIDDEPEVQLLTLSPNCLLGLGAFHRLTVEATGPLVHSLFPSITVPSSVVWVAPVNIGGVNLISNFGTPSPLDYSPTSILNSTLSLSLLGYDDIDLKYYIPSSTIYTAAWIHGAYTTNVKVDYRTSLLVLIGWVHCDKNVQGTLTINVAPFINATNPTPITLSVNSLDYFRTTSISTQNSFSLKHTVKPLLQIKAQTSTFNYTPPSPGSTGPVSPSVSGVKISITNQGANTNSPMLSNAYQDILHAALEVPVGNTQSIQLQYEIDPADLKANYLHAGTYSTTLDYRVYDSLNAAAPSIQTANLDIEVAEMVEIVVNDDVDLVFDEVSDYQNGVETIKNGHLTVSSTVPFDVNVRASGTTLDADTSDIPTDVIKISPVSPQPGFNTISLTDQNQVLIDGAAPVIDRQIDLKYAIDDLSKINTHILGVGAGVYQTTLIYSITAD